MNKTSKNKLDLHGVRHDDVERIVENFVLLTKPPLSIITGNSDRMRNIVTTKLCELSIGYETTYYGEIKIFQLENN